MRPRLFRRTFADDCTRAGQQPVARFELQSAHRAVPRSSIAALVNHPPFLRNFMLNFRAFRFSLRARARAANLSSSSIRPSPLFCASVLPPLFRSRRAAAAAAAAPRRAMPSSAPLLLPSPPLPPSPPAASSCRSVFNSAPCSRAPAPDCPGR